MAEPTTKPDHKPGERLGAVVHAVPRTYVVRYGAEEQEITAASWEVNDAGMLEFFDHAGELRAVFRDWSSVMAKLHDEEHPERAGDV